MRLRLLSVGVSASLVLALVGCNAQAESDVVNLEYWTWVSTTKDVVALWNAENPDVQVEVVEAAGASDMAAKLSAAERAGEAPDLAHIEYQRLPNVVASGLALDITDRVESFKDAFTPEIWGLTTLGEQVYAVPSDIGPMLMMYRSDVFDELGLRVPTTWDEYAQLARQVKEMDPSLSLAGYPDDASIFTGYVQQLGGNWWTTDGNSWTVDIDGEASQTVAQYWQDLVEEGVLSTTSWFTPEWNQSLADGTLLSWNTGVWGPSEVVGVAPETEGLWMAAPLPAWDSSGGSDVGFIGGSSTIVSASTEYPDEAVRFLEWINASDEGAGAAASISSLYPAATGAREALNDSPPPALMSAQPDFYAVAAEISARTADVTWGPNVQLTFDKFNDQIKAAEAAGKPFVDILPPLEEMTVADLVKSGFKATAE